MRTLLLFALLFSVLPLQTVWAQFDTNLGNEALIVSLNPQYPAPGETVEATIEDYAINSAGATIVWLLDGNQIANTTNKRTITLNAPPVGTSLKVTAQLIFKQQPKIEASVVIKPFYFDLIIEPLTHTPIFYQGRALPVLGSIVNLTALLHTQNGLVDASKYTYNWTLNNKSVYSGARVGAFHAQITVPQGRNSTLTVTVQDPTGAIVMRRLVNIPTVPVELQFYELNTLFGLSAKAITDNLVLVGNSTSIRVVPYYLDTRAIDNSLYTQWTIGGIPVQTENDSPFEINLKRGSAGTTNVGFKLRNLNELIQSAEGTVKVEF